VKHDTIKYSSFAIVGANGKLLRTLARMKPFTGDVGAPMWSPDGKRLVFEIHNSRRGKPAGGQALMIINSNGSGKRRLTPWSLHAGDHPDWSPDGKQILFRTIRPNDEFRGGTMYTIHPDGTGLTKLRAGSPQAMILNSSFSPDGTSITYAASGTGGQPDIFVMNADGTGERAITQTAEWDSGPDWGPTHP
jgi:Tol biopolymer transport system component